MSVFVFVVLRQMQPDAPAHQDRRHPERRIGRFAEQNQRHRRANERCSRKVGPRPRSLEAAEGQHKHYEADAIAE